MPKSADSANPNNKTGRTLREERLARALRANLHRRKAQVRGRAGPRNPAGGRAGGGRDDG